MRVKHKVSRHICALNKYEEEMLQELMQEDGKTEVSAFLGFLISSEYKKRREDNRSKTGGAKRVKEEETIKEKPYIKDPNPMNNGRLLTEDEWRNYYTFRGEPLPDLGQYLATQGD